MRAPRFASAAVVFTALVSPSCSEALSPEDLAGTYEARTLTVTPAGESTIDALAAGTTLTITLVANGTTTGHLSIPASLNEGTPLEADLVGTFTLSGEHVEFTQSADTFVRDMTFVFAGSSLSSVGVFSGDTVRVTLTRS